jgi:hypothetical protein
MYGVGINDVPGSWGKPYYKRWENMHQRCYSDNFHTYFPPYKECTVAEEWQTLSTFKSWYEQQGDVDTFHLDKDIRVPGNKVYGPDTCLFVSPELNQFLVTPTTKRKLLPGVHVNKNGITYRALISADGKKVTIGCSYKTEEEAFDAYVKYKQQRLYDKFIVNETNPLLKDALINVYNHMREWILRHYD